MYKKITSISAAFTAMGMDMAIVIPAVTKNYEAIAKLMPDNGREVYVKREVARYKLEMGIKSINGAWEADWKNTRQRKYYPWWVVVDKSKQSGFGLSYHDYDFTHTNSIVGLRLVYETREKAEHGRDILREAYEDYYLI